MTITYAFCVNCCCVPMHWQQLHGWILLITMWFFLKKNLIYTYYVVASFLNASLCEWGWRISMQYPVKIFLFSFVFAPYFLSWFFSLLNWARNKYCYGYLVQIFLIIVSGDFIRDFIDSCKCGLYPQLY